MTHSAANSHAIGIDFGGTSIKPALVKGAEIIERGATINPQNVDAAEVLFAIEQSIRHLCGSLPSLVPVGIGLPGLVDSNHGIVHGLSNVSGWDEIPVSRILGDRLGVPVILENDANAMAYGEWKYGAAASTRHAVCITLGTGVGGGLILDGKLFRGAQLAAGEVGHTSIDYRGAKGPYGNFGCLESYVGNHWISKRAKEAYQAANRVTPSPECTPEHLAKAAHDGCAIAKAIWDAVGDEIGTALSNVIWLLNPDAIVIGGGVAKAGRLIFEPLERSIRSRTSRVVHEKLRLLPAMLGNDAGAIGCGALALEAIR